MMSIEEKIKICAYCKSDSITYPWVRFEHGDKLGRIISTYGCSNCKNYHDNQPEIRELAKKLNDVYRGTD
jgi:hypothetical protein